MEKIQLPQTSEHPIEQSGYWLSVWDRRLYYTRQEAQNSWVTEKILNFVSALLRNIVSALNNNFSIINDKVEKIIHDREGENDKVDQLLSKMEALDSKVDRLQDSLKNNVKNLDIIIPQPRCWTNSIKVEEKIEQKSVTIQPTPFP